MSAHVTAIGYRPGNRARLQGSDRWLSSVGPGHTAVLEYPPCLNLPRTAPGQGSRTSMCGCGPTLRSKPHAPKSQKLLSQAIAKPARSLQGLCPVTRVTTQGAQLAACIHDSPPGPVYQSRVPFPTSALSWYRILIRFPGKLSK